MGTEVCWKTNIATSSCESSDPSATKWWADSDAVLTQWPTTISSCYQQMISAAVICANDGPTNCHLPWGCLRAGLRYVSRHSLSVYGYSSIGNRVNQSSSLRKVSTKYRVTWAWTKLLRSECPDRRRRQHPVVCWYGWSRVLVKNNGVPTGIPVGLLTSDGGTAGLWFGRSITSIVQLLVVGAACTKKKSAEDDMLCI